MGTDDDLKQNEHLLLLTISPRLALFTRLSGEQRCSVLSVLVLRTVTLGKDRRQGLPDLRARVTGNQRFTSGTLELWSTSRVQTCLPVH